MKMSSSRADELLDKGDMEGRLAIPSMHRLPMPRPLPLQFLDRLHDPHP